TVLDRVLGPLDALRQRQLVARRGDHHDGLADARQDRGDVVDQRRPVPVQERLGPAHAARPAAGQEDRGGVRHGQWADTYWMIMLSVIHSIGALSSVSGLLDGPIGRRWRASAAAGSSG